jgi:hypothetical protein
MTPQLDVKRQPEASKPAHPRGCRKRRKRGPGGCASPGGRLLAAIAGTVVILDLLTKIIVVGTIDPTSPSRCSAA